VSGILKPQNIEREKLKMRTNWLRTLAIVAIAGAMMIGASARLGLAAEAQPSAAGAAADGATVNFTLVSVMIDDVKFWLPSTIVVNQGDKVKLTLKNQVPGSEITHGFTVPGYNIAEVITRGQPKTITFVADKAGIFPYYCQLHPAHIGGQLIVRAKQ
jgi:nitrosocyanin